MLVRDQIKYNVEDQLILLNQVVKGELNVTFEEKLHLPTQSELDDILAMTNQFMINSNEVLFIEIQVLLFLTIVQGLSLVQAINLKFSNWKELDRFSYEGTKLSITSKNTYCDGIIKILDHNDHNEKVFRQLNQKNVLNCLNLYLVMNGLEILFTAETLKITFGRFHYLRHGRFRGTREFLKNYFSCDSHIELLVKLKLVDSIFYNTMMRD
ncbi:MAG: hypothetical protein ABJG41_08785 [Cyclobacteriaceae bacterium]